MCPAVACYICILICPGRREGRSRGFAPAFHSGWWNPQVSAVHDQMASNMCCSSPSKIAHPASVVRVKRLQEPRQWSRLSVSRRDKSAFSKVPNRLYFCSFSMSLKSQSSSLPVLLLGSADFTPCLSTQASPVVGNVLDRKMMRGEFCLSLTITRMLCTTKCFRALGSLSRMRRASSTWATCPKPERPKWHSSATVSRYHMTFVAQVCRCFRKASGAIWCNFAKL